MPYKQIDWIIAFFTVLILANLFTLIVGTLEEQQQLFLNSIECVLLLVVYAFKLICKRKK